MSRIGRKPGLFFIVACFSKLTTIAHAGLSDKHLILVCRGCLGGDGRGCRGAGWGGLAGAPVGRFGRGAGGGGLAGAPVGWWFYFRRTRATASAFELTCSL